MFDEYTRRLEASGVSDFYESSLLVSLSFEDLVSAFYWADVGLGIAQDYPSELYNSLRFECGYVSSFRVRSTVSVHDSIFPLALNADIYFLIRPIILQ